METVLGPSNRAAGDGLTEPDQGQGHLWRISASSQNTAAWFYLCNTLPVFRLIMQDGHRTFFFLTLSAHFLTHTHIHTHAMHTPTTLLSHLLWYVQLPYNLLTTSEHSLQDPSLVFMLKLQSCQIHRGLWRPNQQILWQRTDLHVMYPEQKQKLFLEWNRRCFSEVQSI